MPEGILFIGPLPPPYGGMAISLENLISSEIKERYDLSVLDITGFRTRGKTNILYAAIYQLGLIFRLFFILTKKRPRIVHVELASFFYFYRRGLDILFCKLCGRKIILRLHGGKFLDFYRQSLPSGKSFIRFILRLSDRLILLSERWRKPLQEMVGSAKVTVIPNAVRCQDFVLKNNKKKELQAPQESIWVIFLGAIGKNKGVFDILQAIPEIQADCNNIKFLFFGSEEERGDLARFKAEVMRLGIGNAIMHKTEALGQEKIDYYLSSDIFVLPSYTENLPNSLLEAMAAGLAVVASDTGAIPELIKDGENGFLVKAGNVQAIREKIILLAKDANLRKAMGSNNRVLARSSYDLPLIAKKIDEVYKGVIYA